MSFKLTGIGVRRPLYIRVEEGSVSIVAPRVTGFQPVGGIMSDTSFSPVDPVFWLHHAEVDRLWHVWQIDRAAAHPNLTGKSAKMDPWTETYQQLQAIETLGYTYA